MRKDQKKFGSVAVAAQWRQKDESKQARGSVDGRGHVYRLLWVTLSSILALGFLCTEKGLRGQLTRYNSGTGHMLAVHNKLGRQEALARNHVMSVGAVGASGLGTSALCVG